MPKVSILICAYNSWNYIFQTIQSVLSQTYWEFELLILDNNSKDETVKNIQSFQDDRIKLFQSDKNYWPYWWINYLLDRSSWNYIAILDHDDLWSCDKLEKQVDFLDNHTEFIWCGTKTVMYYESDSKYFEYYLQEKNYYTIHSSLMFRNGKYRYDDTIFYFADGYFQKNILCKWEKFIYNLDEPLTFHLIKDNFNNLSYSWFKINYANFKRVFDLHWITLYAFLALWYELSRYIIIRSRIAKVFPKFFKCFDRAPYKVVGGEFKDFEGSDVEKKFKK
jgi:glycosyltransferase involved in cell wall biosynthesis